MTRIDLLVHAPHLLSMAGPGVGYRANAGLAIDAPHHVMLPGLIDAHMHTGLALLRGLAQDTRHWMMHGLGPFADQLDVQAMDAGSRLAIVEALHAGSTTFGDFGWQMHGVCAFLQQAGARGLVCVTIREAVQRIYAPGELYTFDAGLGRRQLEAGLALFDRWHGAANGRIRVLLGPQGADFVGADLLMEGRRLAIERDTRIHMHTAQGDRETQQMLGRYSRRSIPWLDEQGYLDHRLQAVHLTD